MGAEMAQAWLKLGLLFLLVAAPASANAEKVLRVVPHADLKVLDPHTNTATITLMHGQMIYDQLFGGDPKLEPKPQMVDRYEISHDKLAYTFTQRPGLKFHDGQPVTTRDVIASLKRWMVRDTLGQILAAHMDRIEASGDSTFAIHLKEPFGFVEMALGATAAVIMRAQDATTAPFKAGTTTIRPGAVFLLAPAMEPRGPGVFRTHSG